jgi:hypothetical protein
VDKGQCFLSLFVGWNEKAPAQPGPT